MKTAKNESPVTPRGWRPTTNGLLLGLLAFEGVLFLSEQFRIAVIGERKGWAVLLAAASAGAAVLLALPCVAFALFLRRRFRFGRRGLVLLLLAVAFPCAWLVASMRASTAQGADHL